MGQVDGAIQQDVAERSAHFRSLVNGRRMLIVLDNARTIDTVRPLLPGAGTSLVVVTSRDDLAGLVAREGAHRIDLDRFSEGEAQELLETLLGSRVTTEPEAAGMLIERCVRLPLALRVAAELVGARHSRSIASLAEELSNQQDRLDLLDIDGDPHTAVRAVFSWSYQHVSADAARVFRFAGLHPGHDMAVDVLAAVVGFEPRTTRRSLNVLVRAHLIDETPDARFEMHDLLHAYAASVLEATESTADRAAALIRLLDHYVTTAAAAMDVIAPHEKERRTIMGPRAGAATSFGSHDAAECPGGSLEHPVALPRQRWLRA